MTKSLIKTFFSLTLSPYHGDYMEGDLITHLYLY